MNRIFFVAVFALIANLSFAQKNYQDVIYLKNGSIIRGLIIEQVVNESFKIETTDDNVFVFEIDKIEKIAKEPTTRKTKQPPESYDFKKGFTRIFEVGYGMTFYSSYMDGSINLDFIYGYKINKYFSIGVGSGLWSYPHNQEAVPLYADFRSPFLSSRFSPYFSLKMGYAFDPDNRFESIDTILNPSIGVRHKISGKSEMNLSCGYKKTMKNYHEALILNVGISF